ncbi:cAMP-regulated phosphoprotein 21-like [Panonychus citri]|uniref:cAMP-regulated phosphoprotein 21-like n=1 Tax=Panonychus citri TaxID=50023 RepID=UPI002307FD6A|nr:cAMP-regulated phosphoprotein 21-like [Panonychus citri]XP_053201151.1 cAMP-regulated phosphoprotein 21-like [Panonychus citri]XP_053201152.1 cAMP-regulated phosphoprotein 21-like [Panonychus citri]
MTTNCSAQVAETAVSPNQDKAEEESIEISNDHSNNQNCDNANGNYGSDNVIIPETSKPPPSPSNGKCKLTKEPTAETYTDHTGTDLMQFLTDTLQNNPKDRVHLLKIEKQLTDLVKDPKRSQHKFGPMSSYHRMLVHRVAAFFGMDHNVTNVDNSVIVSKTRTTRLPEFKFSEQIKNTSKPESNEPVRSIIKRDSSSLDKLSEKGYLNDKSPDRRGNTLHLVESRRSKSLEEREEEYEKARARIFNQESTSSTETPSDACANSSATDDSVATTSSGIVVSTSATNSSLSVCNEDLKSGSNWSSTGSRLWSSTESEGSNKPRFLRLQRQKRLPDSFDSDSSRASFTTSSSLSSASGMFLNNSAVTSTGPQAQLSPPPSIGCNNGIMNHSQSFPYTVNQVSLPLTHSNSGQVATASDFRYTTPVQVPPSVPMYVSPHGGAFAPNQFNGARPMPPSHQLNGTRPMPPPHQLNGARPMPTPQHLSGARPMPPSHQMNGARPMPPSHQLNGTRPMSTPHQLNGARPIQPPHQLNGARPIPPPHQAQIIPSSYTPQNPVHHPVPLFFVFNFQKNDSNSLTETPSDACANSATTGDPLATTSSGIVVSTANSSSPNCCHEDLKQGSNWPSTDPRLWNSTESEGSNSNRPRFLRLQRQKRLPDNFNSDSSRTSFITSPSISSANGMFLSGSTVTGTGPQTQLSSPPPSISCNNGMMNHNQSFPYTINHMSLPQAHHSSGQLATATDFRYSTPMQVPPSIPMYVSPHGGAFAPNQFNGARPMPPPHQAQIIPSPYSPQNPVHRPIPLFFVFNFQNKRYH